jgi:hypothetical protein
MRSNISSFVKNYNYLIIQTDQSIIYIYIYISFLSQFLIAPTRLNIDYEIYVVNLHYHWHIKIFASLTYNFRYDQILKLKIT